MALRRAAHSMSNEGMLFMRVLFIRPTAGFLFPHTPMPPLGPLALASFIQSRGHTVRVFDHQVEPHLMKAAAEFKPDAVAITLLAQSMIPDAVRISRAMKAQGVRVFWGGHMASTIPEKIARSGFVDYVGISEGEYTLLELLEVAQGKRARETVLGISYVDENGEYRRTPDRPFADLADFPPMNYALLPMEQYFTKYMHANRMLPMVTSRGCIFNCTFCFNNEFHRCQRREFPREVIFQQLKTLVRDFRIDGTFFFDELFGADKQALLAFCQGMKDLDLGLIWFSTATAGVLSREDLRLMYDAGCRMLEYGLESGSPEMQKKLNKRFSLAKIDETFRNCRDAGIAVQANFIIGFPDETPEQVRETVRLYFRTRPEKPSVNFYEPIPGTQLYRALEAAGHPLPKITVDGTKSKIMPRYVLDQNYSRVPNRDLKVIMNFICWEMVFGKKHEAPDARRKPLAKMAISHLRDNLRAMGPGGLTRGLWESAKYICTVAWYAHAYPSIRKKYDLYAKNFGRTDWDN